MVSNELCNYDFCLAMNFQIILLTSSHRRLCIHTKIFRHSKQMTDKHATSNWERVRKYLSVTGSQRARQGVLTHRCQPEQLGIDVRKKDPATGPSQCQNNPDVNW